MIEQERKQVVTDIEIIRDALIEKMKKAKELGLDVEVSNTLLGCSSMQENKVLDVKITRTVSYLS